MQQHPGSGQHHGDGSRRASNQGLDCNGNIFTGPVEVTRALLLTRSASRRTKSVRSYIYGYGINEQQRKLGESENFSTTEQLLYIIIVHTGKLGTGPLVEQEMRGWTHKGVIKYVRISYKSRV